MDPGFFIQWSTSTFSIAYDVGNNAIGTQWNMVEARIIGQRLWNTTEFATGLPTKFGHMRMSEGIISSHSL